MTVFVIDTLEVVHIDHYDRKISKAFFDLLVDLDDLVIVSSFVSDSGQRILICLLTDLSDLLVKSLELAFLLGHVLYAQVRTVAFFRSDLLPAFHQVNKNGHFRPHQRLSWNSVRC